jgi:hypothetical protein
MLRYMRKWEYDERKREKSRSKINSKFLSSYFNHVLEGIFISFPSGTVFCAERIQTNFKLGEHTNKTRSKRESLGSLSESRETAGTRDTACSDLLRRKE